MELILSTSNIIKAGSSNFRRDVRSNAELVESLRSNFRSHYTPSDPDDPTIESTTAPRVDTQLWTTRTKDTLEIPTLHMDIPGLQEEREQYDITLKLFFLNQASVENREKHARQALGLVLQELGVPSVDLLIVSHPGIYFDEQEESPEKLQTRAPLAFEPEAIETQLETWAALEKLHDDGLVQQMGVAECGHDRLRAFLERPRIKPSVDQINLRDCCSVPKDLLTLAKENNVILLVHNDCSDILPQGTVRDLLGPGPTGADILADKPKAGEKRKSLHGEPTTNGENGTNLPGEVQPQWVVRYTAVVKDRGVVENKGYFAMAELEAE